ncbi:DNA-3-methyladenine glycosylase family protein [Clostridium cylindrosporum]|uniref:DNA-(apurinic or apyrimidinic site) lyase n=1 Tax=Clostridium cylindrosporum DSM 605 TaxID=1121307 RepID=A0A0J8DGJ9_CLOCY|nr:DNA-3-methyladenine glycosylase [Clostridium cylindrosporum]KMT23303.1 3-methyladenine DNA glycosylase/8-oxoguanine DNA glycosylase [Clostridium cylindrosporum DSM 605]
MNFKEYDKGLYIENVQDFNIKHIFDCGQCFRWNEEEDGSYIGVIHSKVLRLYEVDGKVYIEGADSEDIGLLEEYFDLKKDYSKIKDIVSENDDVLKEAIKCGEGIRILKQEPFETVISFIISARNSIPNIKRTVEKLSRNFGDKLEFNGKVYYSFPTPKQLSEATDEQLRECGCSFRAPYVLQTTKDVLEGKIDLYALRELSTDEAMEKLTALKGVGIKVADCIMLFSLGKTDAFPVDVWIQRIMEHFYVTEKTSLKKMREYAREKFKENAGIAQQYLFYYARDFKGREGFGKDK